ncbi:hypothetical protein G9A89_020961 [Geosiphon pyriformis]|nr:hypothetical protein G9A89_020961 [Geosiphon pyriformis]
MAFVRRKAPLDDESSIGRKKTRLNSTQDEEQLGKEKFQQGLLTVQTKFLNFLQEIRKEKTENGRVISEIFEKLPSKKQYPDYYALIKEPISLATIQQKVEKREYKTIEQFKDDFDTMFINAKKYNLPGSLVYDDAVYLQKLLVQKVAALISSQKSDRPKTKVSTLSKSKIALKSKHVVPVNPKAISNEGDIDSINKSNDELASKEFSTKKRGSDSKRLLVPVHDETGRLKRHLPKEETSLNTDELKKSQRDLRSQQESLQRESNLKHPNFSSKQGSRSKRNSVVEELAPNIAAISPKTSSQNESTKSIFSPLQSIKSKKTSEVQHNSTSSSPSSEEDLLRSINVVSSKKESLKKELSFSKISFRGKRVSTGAQNSMLEKASNPKILDIPREEFKEDLSPIKQRRFTRLNFENRKSQSTKEEAAKLFKLIAKNNSRAIEKFFSKNEHFDVNLLWPVHLFENDFTWSPLHSAAYHGDIEIIKVLMERGANVELKDTWYAGTPLAWAAFAGDHIAARLLVEEYDADPNVKNVHGQTPFDLVPDPESLEWNGILTETRTTKKIREGITDYNEENQETAVGKSVDYIQSIPMPQAQLQNFHQDQSMTEQLNPEVNHLMKDLWQLLVDHRDSSGRLYSELFMDLPSKEQYPEYYQAIENPISFNIILRKITKGYTSIHDFDRDFQFIFENAMYFNEDGSRIFKDARLLQKLYNNNKRSLFKACGFDLVSTPSTPQYNKNTPMPNTRISSPETRRPILTLEYQSVTYGIGDFVYVPDPNSSSHNIIVIERLFMNSKLQKRFAGSMFFRPDQTEHDLCLRFFEKEVFKTSVIEEHMLMDIIGKCLVMHIEDYIHGYPEGFDDKDVFVCESSYAVASKFFKPISDWSNTLSVHTVNPVRIIPLDAPRSLARNHEAKSAVSAYAQYLPVPIELIEAPVSHKIRIPAPNFSPSPGTAEIKLPPPISKQTSLISSQKSSDTGKIKIRVKEAHDVERKTSQSPRLRVKLVDQIPSKTPVHNSMKEDINSGGSIENVISPNNSTINDEETASLPNERKRSREEVYSDNGSESEIAFDNKSHPDIELNELALSKPLSKASTSNSYIIIQQRNDNSAIERNVTPMLSQTNLPIQISRVYDASSLDSKRSLPLLQGIGVEASDQSFAMSLDTKHNAHSITLGSTASHVTLIPILASNLLLPVPKAVALYVYHDGLKVSNMGKMSFPNAPSISHLTFTTQLSPGVNNIDIWVSAPLITNDYSAANVNEKPGGNGVVPTLGEGQTERYYIFITKHGE